MSILGYLSSGSSLKKAKKLTLEARQEQGERANQLFQQAYGSFSAVSESYSGYSDTLHNWGLALLYQAQAKPSNEAIKLFEEAVNKFSFCKTISPMHLGAAVDGGVALLGLAKSKQVGLDNELYDKAKESFELAEEIQRGSASYNLACLYAIQNEGDACLKALDGARDYGLVPDEQNIINDDDLNNVKQLPWFAEYIESLKEVVEVEKTEEIDEKDKKVNGDKVDD
jgi:tetratricopeptide (TPR) repeat protein